MALGTNTLKSKLRAKLPLTYWVLALARVCLTLTPQNGYIHPDEYFQNMEVISGDVFLVDAARTWEFNTSFPIRNIFIPKVTFGSVYHLMKNVEPYIQYYFGTNIKTPYYLMAMPRLLFCILSFINDYCMYKISLTYGQNYKTRLLMLASSYVTMIYCCHTFSNSLEVIFFSILLTLVANCMYKSDKLIYHEEFLTKKYKEALTPVEKVKLFKLRTNLPEHSLDQALPIAVLTVVAVFNRPTFIAFALPAIFFWLNRGLGSNVVTFLRFHERMFVLVVYSILPTITLILLDSIYYGYFTFSELASLKITMNNYVVTPLNFLRYNLNADNLAKHGTHPHWLHFLVNVPLLFNVLGTIGLSNAASMIYRFWRGYFKRLPRIQSITGLMFFSFVAPIAILSIFPHQEPRFIIPALFPLVFLYGSRMQMHDSDSIKIKMFKKYFLRLWFIINGFFILFYGFVHQGGLYLLTKHYFNELKSSNASEMHLFTSHVYSLPTSLFQLESTNKLWFNKVSNQHYKLIPRYFFHEYGSMELDMLLRVIGQQIATCEANLVRNKKKYRVYLAIPCSLKDLLLKTAYNNEKVKFYEESHLRFYPHLSTEAFPIFPFEGDLFCTKTTDLIESQISLKKLNLFNRFNCFLKKFCLMLYEVSLRD